MAELSQALTSIREALEVVRSLKIQLTAIGATSSQVSAGLDKLRSAILGQIARAEGAIAS
jgi:hypothetical protein